MAADATAKVAAVQFEPALFRKEENISALLRLSAEAASAVGPGGLVVLPEMATTGYVFRDRDEIAPYVEPIPGPTTALFGRLCRARGIALVFGMPEVDPATRAYYNSAALIGPTGEVAGVYRKTHSFHCDTLWAAEGNLGLPVFRGNWPGPLGLLICMDAGFFETARIEALAGARVLAFPTNWLRAAPSPEWRARAAENGAYLVAADRWGSERSTTFAGGSCVIGPRGQILAQRERGDGMVLAEIHLANEEAAGGAHGGRTGSSDEAGGPEFGGHVRRRPELYYDLLRHSNLWPTHRVRPGMGEGSFRLGAGDGALDDPDTPGRLLVLPPQPAHSVLELAARKEVYVAAAAGPGEDVILAGPAGLLGRYASPHRPDDPRGAASNANPFQVFDLPFARVGLLHALDLIVPEAARIVSKLGADVVLVSGTWPADLDDLRFLWSERAEPNDIFLAVATDRGGGVFRGGEKAASATMGGSLLLETGPYSYTRRKDVVRRLRPDLYPPLVAGSARTAPAR